MSGKPVKLMKGFSSRSLKYLRAFAETWSNASFVQQVLHELLWGHNMVLLDEGEE